MVPVTALALAVLALPTLLPPASGAGDDARVGATAIVSSPRGAVLMTTITGAGDAVKVTFACRGDRTASTRTLSGVSSDAVAARIAGADAHRLRRCVARVGTASRAVPRLPGGASAAGARLVAILGTMRSLAGGVAQLDVVLAGRGPITVKSAAGRTLLKTASRAAGVHRLRVRRAPRGTIVSVAALGRTDAGVVGGLTARPSPTPTPSATPTATPTPTPQATPTPTPGAIASNLTLACPANSPVGAPLRVTGTLTPDGRGQPIVVTFEITGRPPVIANVTTDANGNYVANAPADANAVGTWSIHASFAGGTSLQPSQAPACQTTSP